MNLLESLTTLIDFAREYGGTERRDIARAVKTIEKKVEALRIKRVVHSRRHCCPRCKANCSGVVCWRCWTELPEDLRKLFESAKSPETKREAMRAVLEHVNRETAEALA